MESPSAVMHFSSCNSSTPTSLFHLVISYCVRMLNLKVGYLSLPSVLPSLQYNYFHYWLSISCQKWWKTSVITYLSRVCRLRLSFLCSTNSPTAEEIQFALMYDNEKHRILTSFPDFLTQSTVLLIVRLIHRLIGLALDSWYYIFML